jgi:hypothetical protein
MYKIIGADQREYGPVPIEQVRKWIAERRANGQTKAWSETSGEWKTLADFPEFTDALMAQGAVAQPPPPKLAALDADKLAAEIIARDYRVDIGDCFSRSWNLVRDNFWLLVGATAVAKVIGYALGFVPALGIPVAVLLGLVFQGGLHWLFLKRVRGEPADLGDVFAGFSMAFVPLLLAGIVVHVLVGIGLALCIVPGVYLVVAWRMFVPLLIIDKGLEFWPAMELSRKVVTKHWWQCFGLFLLAVLIGFLGLLGCIVGIFFTLPIAVGATVYAYLDIFGAHPAVNGLLGSPTLGPALTPVTPSEPSATPPHPTPTESAAPDAVPIPSSSAPEADLLPAKSPEHISPAAPPAPPAQSAPDNPGGPGGAHPGSVKPD